MNNNPYTVKVAGGDLQGRELLASTIAENLRSQAYTNVSRLTYGNKSAHNELPPLTIYNVVRQMRPNLFNAVINVSNIKEDNILDIVSETRTQQGTKELERENEILQKENQHLETVFVDIYNKIQNSININNEG